MDAAATRQAAIDLVRGERARRVARRARAKAGHISTDPICLFYTEPTGRLSKWWFDRKRGIPCRRCLNVRATAEMLSPKVPR